MSRSAIHSTEERLQARDRFGKLPADQRGRWLDVAEAEFRTLGFEAASLNGILARAGISKGQAYYYFSDKGELYRAVVERALEDLAARLPIEPKQPETAEAFWSALAAFFTGLTTVLRENDRLAELGRGIYRDARAQVAIADLLEDLHARFGRWIEDGQRLGAVRSDLPRDLLTDLAFAILREADRWFALHMRDFDRDSALALNRRVFALFQRLLAPDDAGDMSFRFQEPL